MTTSQERSEPANLQGLPGPADADMATVVASLFEKLAERFGGRASVGTVFGEPVTAGGVTVIPVARVALGLGGGGGRERVAAGAREGLGSGGGVLTRPAGFIEVRDGRAAYVPIRDQRAETFYGVAALLAAWSAPRIIRSLTRGRRK